MPLYSLFPHLSQTGLSEHWNDNLGEVSDALEAYLTAPSDFTEPKSFPATRPVNTGIVFPENLPAIKRESSLENEEDDAIEKEAEEIEEAEKKSEETEEAASTESAASESTATSESTIVSGKSNTSESSEHSESSEKTAEENTKKEEL